MYVLLCLLFPTASSNLIVTDSVAAAMPARRHGIVNAIPVHRVNSPPSSQHPVHAQSKSLSTMRWKPCPSGHLVAAPRGLRCASIAAPSVIDARDCRSAMETSADRIGAQVENADYTVVQDSLDADRAGIAQHDLARLDSEAEEGQNVWSLEEPVFVPPPLEPESTLSSTRSAFSTTYRTAQLSWPFERSRLNWRWAAGCWLPISHYRLRPYSQLCRLGAYTPNG
jgi:hypothetical protein